MDRVQQMEVVHGERLRGCWSWRRPDGFVTGRGELLNLEGCLGVAVVMHQ